jgi:hypothetical protein
MKDSTHGFRSAPFGSTRFSSAQLSSAVSTRTASLPFGLLVTNNYRNIETITKENSLFLKLLVPTPMRSHSTLTGVDDFSIFMQNIAVRMRRPTTKWDLIQVLSENVATAGGTFRECFLIVQEELTAIYVSFIFVQLYRNLSNLQNWTFRDRKR